MASLLVFYVCAIGLYIVIEARYYRKPYIPKEPEDGMKEDYISVEPNNRIDEGASGDLSKSDAEWIGPKIDAMEERLDEASNRSYRFKTESYLKCAKSKHRSCNMLRRRSSRDHEWDLHQRDLMRSWSNQLRAVEKLIDHTSMKEAQGNRKRKSDFQELLEGIEMKRTRETTVIPVTLADKSMAEEFFNALNVIDETDVRTALKSDPFIRRILAIGRSKRDKFYRDLEKSNITLSMG